MTSEDKVKAIYPRARATRYRTNGGSVYYLVWSHGDRGRDTRRLSEGKTASAAWVAAANRLLCGTGRRSDAEAMNPESA